MPEIRVVGRGPQPHPQKEEDAAIMAPVFKKDLPLLEQNLYLFLTPLFKRI